MTALASSAIAPVQPTRLPTSLPATRDTDVPNPKQMCDRVDRDLRLRRSITKKSAEQIRMFLAEDDDVWENHAFEYTANTVGAFVSGPPSVRITDGGVEDDHTRLVQDALRSQVVRQEMVSVLRRLAGDIPFDFSVAMVKLRPTQGVKYEGRVIPLEPCVERISPRRYGRDADTPLFGLPRHEFHIVVARRSELLEHQADDGTPLYDAQKVRQLQQGPLAQLRKELKIDGISLSEEDSDIVILYEIFVRDLFDVGGWLTMAPDGGDGVYLREPRPAVCCESGPYALGGLHYGPDQVYPTAPLAVTRRHVEELNAFHKQITEDAKSLKRLTFVDGQQPGLVANIRDANSGDVVSVPGWGGHSVTADLGGVNPGLLEHVAGRKQLLDRVSSLTDTERGNVAPGATATGIDRAASFSTMRREIAQSSFNEFIASLLSKYADFMGSCKEVCFPFTYEDPTAGGAGGKGGSTMIRSTFYGGEYNADDGYPWKRRYQAMIEPNSMSYTHKGALRAEMAEFQQRVIGLLSATQSMPFIQVRAMIDDLAQTLNLSKAATRYVDFELLRATIQRAQAVQAMAAQPGPTPAAGPASAADEQSGPSPAQLGARARQENA